MKSWVKGWRGSQSHTIVAPKWLVVLGVVTSLVVCTASLLVAARDWRTAVDLWRARTSAASQLLAAHSQQVLLGAEVILRGLQRDIVSLGIEDEDVFRKEMASQRIFDTLRDRMEGAPQIDVATITDVKGRVLNFSREFPPPPINLSDRDYFRKKMLEGSSERFVSVPVQNRGTGAWTFYMAEPITSKAGKLLGLALVGIRSDFFTDFYRAAFQADQREVVLVRNDGIVLAREPRRIEPGQSIAQALFLKDPASFAKGGWTVAPGGEPGMDRPRFIGATQVSGFPATVAVAVFGDLALTPWREMTRFLALSALGLSALLIGFGLWGARMLGNQRRMLLEVNNARDAAERADRAKTTFLSVVSHELRTPLNSLVGGADLVRRATSIDQMHKYSGVIDASARQLLGMIDGILNFTKADLQNAELRKAVFSLRDLCSNCISIGRGMAAQKPIKLSCDIDASVPARLVGDADILGQVLLNLISNAVKYTEGGVISILASARPGEGDAVMLQMSVQDSGRGIPADLRERLFQPFQRGNAQEVQAQQGSGLGLAIVERYVRKMGGSIRVEEALAGGANFIIEIPIAAAAEAEAVETEDSADGALRVLVAEDTAASRFVVRAMLEKLGHDVTVTTNGAEAVEAAGMKRYDLVLLDIEMQGMGGLEASRLIRVLPGYANVPVVAMTAYSDQDTLRLAEEAGMARLFTKPVRLSDLAKLIHDIAPPTARLAS